MIIRSRVGALGDSLKAPEIELTSKRHKLGLLEEAGEDFFNEYWGLEHSKCATVGHPANGFFHVTSVENLHKLRRKWLNNPTRVLSCLSHIPKYLLQLLHLLRLYLFILLSHHRSTTWTTVSRTIISRIPTVQGQIVLVQNTVIRIRMIYHHPIHGRGVDCPWHGHQRSSAAEAIIRR